MKLELTQEQALQLCDQLNIHSTFFNPCDEEYILLKENNPSLLEAFENLYDYATNEELL